MSHESILLAKSLIQRIRHFIKSEGLKSERLPKWPKFANVKICKLNNSTIFLFEESIEHNDVFSFSADFGSDLQFFLALPKHIPKNAVFNAPSGKGLIILVGEYGEGKSVVINVSYNTDALYNVGYVQYHSPIGIFNIFLNLRQESDVLATKFIPFALYVHDSDSSDFEKLWEHCTPHLQDVLRFVHNSEEGNYYQMTTERKMDMLVYKEKSVIVFGKDSDTESLIELHQVRDYLKTREYEAYLLRELPEHPLMSIEEKAKLWAIASRFCVIVDREPSGHIAEYAYLENERVILAFLRPKGRGSTYMIGDDSLAEKNNIRVFEFESHPVQVLDEVIIWAEEFVQKKIKALKEAYPWRR